MLLRSIICPCCCCLAFSTSSWRCTALVCSTIVLFGGVVITVATILVFVRALSNAARGAVNKTFWTSCSVHLNVLLFAILCVVFFFYCFKVFWSLSSVSH